MKNKITIPNPLFLWTGLAPKVKMTLIICITLIIIVSMITGYFTELKEIFFSVESKK